MKIAFKKSFPGINFSDDWRQEYSERSHEKLLKESSYEMTTAWNQTWTAGMEKKEFIVKALLRRKQCLALHGVVEHRSYYRVQR